MHPNMSAHSPATDVENAPVMANVFSDASCLKKSELHTLLQIKAVVVAVVAFHPFL